VQTPQALLQYWLLILLLRLLVIHQVPKVRLLTSVCQQQGWRA
jgi:hypothetical protein